MTRGGNYEIKPLVYEKFQKRNKCISIDGKLGDGLMFFYEFIKFTIRLMPPLYTNNIDHEK
jgi:hypothetical protein